MLCVTAQRISNKRRIPERRSKCVARYKKNLQPVRQFNKTILDEASFLSVLLFSLPFLGASDGTLIYMYERESSLNIILIYYAPMWPLTTELRVTPIQLWTSIPAGKIKGGMWAKVRKRLGIHKCDTFLFDDGRTWTCEASLLSLRTHEERQNKKSQSMLRERKPDVKTFRVNDVSRAHIRLKVKGDKKAAFACDDTAKA